jgi:PmbA protein
MPVLFSPQGALALVLPLVAGLDGKSVYTHASPLSNKLGAKLFDDKVTLIDDGTIDGRPGSASYDDEGVPHRRNVLVDRGVVKSFFYDLKTGAQSGVQSTGNGSRHLFSPPSPSLTNLIVEGGQIRVAEMLADIQHGLWVEIPLGLGQGNVISGAFSNSWSLAYKIERGEMVGRVKDVSIAGNVYDALQKVAAVSRETQWVYGKYCLPHILIDDMNVVCKE